MVWQYLTTGFWPTEPTTRMLDAYEMVGSLKLLKFFLYRRSFTLLRYLTLMISMAILRFSVLLRYWKLIKSIAILRC
jgi:hypothetical protein